MSTKWPRDAHTGAKHEILRRYLGAWLGKLAWTRKLLFVDGFAGPGEYTDGELGSPIIALRVAIGHTALRDCEVIFLLIEQDKARFQHLEQTISAISLPKNIIVDCFNGAFAERMEDVLRSIGNAQANMAPSFVMVDPFGVKGMPLRLLQRIAAHPRSELLISLMYEPIARFKSQPEFEPHLNDIYGTDRWHESMTDSYPTPESRRQFLLELYLEQLRVVCGLQYVTPFEMRDSGNRVEYYLIHATASIDGLKAMKAAMWAADPTGAFQFRDTRLPNQTSMFGQTLHEDELRFLIPQKFARQRSVPTKDIEAFVVADTPFLDSHYKRVLKRLETEGRLIVTRPLGGRRGTFPGKGELLDFV